MKTRFIIIAIIFLLIGVIWAILCNYSCKATIFQSFQIKDVILQRIDMDANYNDNLYLMDFKIERQKPKKSWSHTSPFLEGISMPLQRIEITDKEGKEVSDLLHTPFTDTCNVHHLNTQFPKQFFLITPCLDIKRLIDFINSAKSDIGDLHKDGYVHCSLIFKYPKDIPLPQKICLYFNEGKIEKMAYNQPIKVNLGNEYEY